MKMGTPSRALGSLPGVQGEEGTGPGGRHEMIRYQRRERVPCLGSEPVLVFSVPGDAVRAA